MKRRDFLATDAVGLAASTVAAPAITQGVMQWKMVTA